MEEIKSGFYRISLGLVNVYLLENESDLLLIDTGMPGSERRILRQIDRLGRRPSDLKWILVTHLHRDHSGSLAALKQRTGARALMHPADAALVRQGVASRPSRPAPVLIYRLLFPLVMGGSGPMRVPSAEIEWEIQPGERLPFGGGMEVIHAPGHSAGQVVLRWQRHGGVLIAGDAASTLLGLGYPPIFEDLPQGRSTLNILSELEFQTACFGHGKPLLVDASRKFRRRWG